MSDTKSSFRLRKLGGIADLKHPTLPDRQASIRRMAEKSGVNSLPTRTALRLPAADEGVYQHPQIYLSFYLDHEPSRP
ncbi:MAG: hypothetical protein ACKO85_07700, partial [Isosphaeraceae bacterium]